MKLLSFTLLAVGLASVSALPAVIVGGSSDNIEMQPRGGGAGFQDYVIPAGPTGVDLAGALNEIQGYGNQNTLAQGKTTCASIPNCLAVISQGGYVSVNAANLEGNGVTGLGDSSLSWRYDAPAGPRCYRWINFFAISGKCRCLPVIQKQDPTSDFGCVNRFWH